MLILALDTTLAACSVAVFDTGTGGARAKVSKRMEKGHAEAIAPMLAEALTMAQCDVADLGRIAVTTGPGSYTGLRVGLSAAYGLALAHDVPLIGVSSLMALALSVGHGGPVLATIDARHGHLYAALYDGGETLLAPACLPLADVASLLTPQMAVVGNGQALLGRSGAPDVPDMAMLAAFAATADAVGWPAEPLYLKAADAKPKAVPAVETACSAV